MMNEKRVMPTGVPMPAGSSIEDMKRYTYRMYIRYYLSACFFALLFWFQSLSVTERPFQFFPLLLCLIVSVGLYECFGLLLNPQKKLPKTYIILRFNSYMLCIFSLLIVLNGSYFFPFMSQEMPMRLFWMGVYGASAFLSFKLSSMLQKDMKKAEEYKK